MTAASDADTSPLDRHGRTRFNWRIARAAKIIMAKNSDTAEIERPAKSPNLWSPNQTATRSYSVKGMKLSLVRQDIYRRATRGKGG